MADKKTSTDAFGESRAVSLEKSRLRRVYTIWCCVLFVLLAAGIISFTAFELKWGLVLVPFLAAMTAMLLWCIIARFVFADNYGTLLQKSFKRCLKLSLFMPVYSLALIGLLALPVSTEVLNSGLASGFSYLLTAAALTILPMSFLVCGLLGVGFGISHWRNTPQTASHIYREGPFALSLILFLTECGVCVWVIMYFLQ